jgi:hypothetical protein
MAPGGRDALGRVHDALSEAWVRSTDILLAELRVEVDSDDPRT